jgi:hypothetical protein
MEIWERNKCILRIVSGSSKVRVGDTIFFIRSPSMENRMLAEDLYLEQIEDSSFMGAFSDSELMDFLEFKKIWTQKHQKDLDVVTEDVKKLKIGVFELRLRSYELKKARDALQRAKDEALRLELLKHSYDHLSVSGMAGAAKNRFLLGSSVFYRDGMPYWTDEHSWNLPDPFLDRIMICLNKLRLGEFEMRELAREDPWRSTWNLQKHCGKPLFDSSALDISEEQKSFIFWSCIYESAREYGNYLSEDIIADDDMFDGWMLIRHKEREKNQAKSLIDSLPGSDKVKNAGEQFYMADTKENARKIIGMNEENTNMQVQQRFQVIKQRGEVSDHELPDVAARLRMEKAQRATQLTKGTK